jgi:succinoglycan biosynthesis transport protein ExoP
VNRDEPGLFEQALKIIRRRKWLILQAVIIVPVLALLFSLSQTKEYTASATLLFRQISIPGTETGNVLDPSREAATNGQLVALPVVAEVTAERLEGISDAEVEGSVSISPGGEAETAVIEATTPDPETSAKIANAYGLAYIAFRRKADRAQVQNAIDLAETSYDELSPEQQSAPEGTALQKQLDQLRLVQALQTGGAELVQKASPPTSPSKPETKRNVALGLILGILLGAIIALIVDRFDRRVRSLSELEELYKLPVLARIPRSRKLRDLKQGDLGARSLEGESFRLLRTNLRYLAANRDLNSLLVVSPEAGDGKSTVVHGLATTMAEMGERVVLVEADLRKGSKMVMPDGSQPVGLSAVLTGVSVDSVLVEVRSQPEAVNGRSLSILPSGSPPPNPTELLESPRMAELLDELEDRFDMVILDTPALGAFSDALTLVPLASGVIVVAGLGRTRRDSAQQLETQFSMLDRKPLGLVVDFAESDRAKYSHYYRTAANERDKSRT